MAVYNKSKTELQAIYNSNGYELTTAYNKDGTKIYQKDPYIDGRVLVYEDDFDGNTLDSTYWGYELGDVRNNELQTYKAQNVTLENGCLVITAKKEDFGEKHWTSGSITGNGKQTFGHGRFDAKIKFPKLSGAFGAFWMMGSNRVVEYHETGAPTRISEVGWPDCGEIDVTETIPGTATMAKANLWDNVGVSLGGGNSSAIDISEWNIYSCEYTDTYIAMLVNGTEYKRWTYSDYSSSRVSAYQLPMEMLLNLAVGASGGTPSESTSEMKMYVDWVRVYAPLT